MKIVGNETSQKPLFLRCLPKIRLLRGFKRFQEVYGKQNWHCETEHWVTVPKCLYKISSKNIMH